MRFAYHLDDARQHRLCAHFFGAERERAFLIERAFKNLVSLFFEHGDGFAAQQALINIRTTLNDRSVDGYLLARANEQEVATHYFADFYLLLSSLAQDGRRLRAQSHEFFQGGGRVGLCARLEQATYEDERDDAARGVEVEMGVLAQHLREEEVENAKQIGDACG